MFDRLGKTIAALAVLGAIAVGASAVASAASSGTTTSQGGGASTSQAAPQGTPSPGSLSHGPGETLLSGDTAAKVKQAALDKVPGATVTRVETDSEGSPYEAHLQKSDGSEVTVKVNDQFQVTSVESGFGGGPPNGAPPAQGN